MGVDRIFSMIEDIEEIRYNNLKSQVQAHLTDICSLFICYPRTMALGIVLTDNKLSKAAVLTQQW